MDSGLWWRLDQGRKVKKWISKVEHTVIKSLHNFILACESCQEWKKLHTQMQIEKHIIPITLQM
jgi:hypothetical protein